MLKHCPLWKKQNNKLLGFLPQERTIGSMSFEREKTHVPESFLYDLNYSTRGVVDATCLPLGMPLGKATDWLMGWYP